MMVSFVCFLLSMGGAEERARSMRRASMSVGTMGSGAVPSFEILDARHPFLRVDDHLAEQVGEAGSAQLRRAAAVQVAVVDGLAV